VVNTNVRGRSYAPIGKKPVTFTVGGTRQKLSMIVTALLVTVGDAINFGHLIFIKEGVFAFVFLTVLPRNQFENGSLAHLIHDDRSITQLRPCSLAEYSA
jgi:hypothetical protein